MGRGRHVASRRQRRQKRLDLFLAQLRPGGACRESGCIFSPNEHTQAVMLQPDAIAKPIEQNGRPGHRRIGRRSVHVQAQLIGHGERYES